MLDADKLRNGADLVQLLEGRANIQHLFLGHVHRPITGQYQGIAFSALPAILYQAPPPVPAWNWSNFTPAAEAPKMAVVTITRTGVILEQCQFCAYDQGGMAIQAP